MRISGQHQALRGCYTSSLAGIEANRKRTEEETSREKITYSTVGDPGRALTVLDSADELLTAAGRGPMTGGLHVLISRRLV